MTRRFNPYRRQPQNTPPFAESETLRPVDNETFEMSRLPLDERLAIAEDFHAAHPGRPISAMLLELFPELNRIGNKHEARRQEQLWYAAGSCSQATCGNPEKQPLVVVIVGVETCTNQSAKSA